MITFKEQTDLFKLIGRELKRKIECFAIGGSAMMFYGAKETTKDVDLVFMKKEDFDLMKKTLYKIGFNEKKDIVKIFEHYEVAEKKPVMMEGRDTRFDLFLEEVISFKISDSILERAREIHEFGNLIIKTVNPEDIILLKCATEREKDREDAFELIKRFNIGWDIIIKESLHQTGIGGDVFPVFLFDFLFELKHKFKADIPDKVLEKIRDLGEQEMIKAIKPGKHIKVTRYKKK
jgi:predicted nucleotidyltransferase